MTLDRTVDRINHVERAAGGAAVGDVPWSHVKRKEFGSESALLHALDAGSIRHRRWTAKIVVVVCHRGRHVVVRVDDDRLAMNLERPLPELFVALRLRGDRRGDHYDKKNQDCRNTKFH